MVTSYCRYKPLVVKYQFNVPTHTRYYKQIKIKNILLFEIGGTALVQSTTSKMTFPIIRY